MRLPQWIDQFRTPPVEYRTAPQWSWNGELTRQRIREQIDQFADNFCGGLYSHARQGFVNGYVTDEWFQLWDYACRYAKQRGMQYHIYDEFCCPGGNAGGQVVKRRPDLGVRRCSLETVTGKGQFGKGTDVLAVFRRGTDGVPPQPVDADELDHASEQSPLLALTLQPPQLGRTFASADLLLPATCKLFLETTHERYNHYSGDEFGQAVRFVFCDEPHLTAGFWPMSTYLLKEFRREHGYDLLEKAGPLLFTQEDSPAVRFDYFMTVNRLFVDNFLRPLYEWCERHGLLLTGHLIENTFPKPLPTPENMAGHRWFHAPGTDLLGFQFKATCPEDNALYLFNQKEMSSVANQLGRTWRMTESTGGPGYHTSFELFKPCEDYLLALGVNHMDPHLAHQSLSGMGKYDFPHTLSDHSPWWKYYHHQATHVARANAALCQGTESSPVAVLHPATSTWMHWQPPTADMPTARSPIPEAVAAIGEASKSLALALYGRQVDFDLASELVMAELARAEDGRLIVGEASYEAVVIPARMDTWTESTVALMEAYLAGGGQVWCVGEPASRVNGRVNAAPADLAKRFADNWHRVETPQAAADAVRAAVGSRVTGPGGAVLPAELCWRRVETPDGPLHFFCNPWDQPIETEVLLPGRGALALDTATGDAAPLATEPAEGGVVAPLKLLPRGHALWLAVDQPVEVPSEAATEPVSVDLALVEVRPTEPNRLPIHWCDLRTDDGVELLGAPTAIANRTNFQAQGVDPSGWGKQVDRNMIDREVDPTTGFTVTYRFEIDSSADADLLAGLGVAIERPWLYEITLNGQSLDPTGGERWFDEEMRLLPVGGLVRPGVNELTLIGRPFRTLHLIMPVWVVGEGFSLQPTDRGWSIAPAGELSPGDWTQQGRPFDPSGIAYVYGVECPEATDGLTLRLGEWAGSVVTVRWDGRRVGEILHPPFELTLPAAQAGGHRLEIEVVGNMRNMMGPHFGSGVTGVWSYEFYPSQAPAGGEYQLIPTGLMETPSVTGWRRTESPAGRR